jgi:type I restriction enzyme S subunit
MNADELKKSIIKYAVQGKLTDRLKEDGNAIDYYKPILKSFNIKIEDLDLFETPENWTWVSLNQISSVISKGTTPTGGKEVYLSKGIPFIRAENIGDDGKLIYQNIKYIDELTHHTILKRSKLYSKDLLISIAGTLGKAAVLDEKYNEINTNQAVSFVRLISHEHFDVCFIRYCISSDLIQKRLLSKNKVTAIPNLTLEIIKNTLIPLPPLAEQKRIVAKLDEIMPIINAFEKDEIKLKEILLNFPKSLKKSILLAAIQGKLSKQLKEDKDPREIFLQKEVNTNKESPFEIPDNWIWLDFDVIISNIGSRKHQILATDVKANGKHPVVSQSKNMIDGYSDDDDKLLKNDQPLILFGDHTKTLKYIDFDFIVGSDGTKLLKVKNSNIKYIYYVLMCYINSLETRNYGRHFKLLSSKLIPIPPIEEQQRIVDKLDQLLSLLEKINNNE